MRQAAARSRAPHSTISAEQWNAQFPIGTTVVYTSSPVSDPFETKTRSAAWTLGHGEPVVLIEGRTGGVALWALTVNGRKFSTI